MILPSSRPSCRLPLVTTLAGEGAARDRCCARVMLYARIEHWQSVLHAAHRTLTNSASHSFLRAPACNTHDNARFCDRRCPACTTTGGADNGVTYAMKALRKEVLLRRNQIEHTKTERAILRAVDHPFIVCLRYAFQTPEKLYLVTGACVLSALRRVPAAHPNLLRGPLSPTFPAARPIRSSLQTLPPAASSFFG